MAGLPALVVSHGPHDYHSFVPRAVFTGTGSDPRPRLRVDQAQTSFYENREFRTYLEFTLAAGASAYIKFDTDADNIIHSRDVTLVTGQLRFSLIAGATASGVWTLMPVYPMNNMADKPAYTLRTTIETGGTCTGGTEVDVMLANAGTGGNASMAHALVSEGSAPAGLIFARLWNNGAQSCTGLYRLAFEEHADAASTILLP